MIQCTVGKDIFLYANDRFARFISFFNDFSVFQVINGNRGVFQSINVQKKNLTVREYEKHATDDR